MPNVHFRHYQKKKTNTHTTKQQQKRDKDYRLNYQEAKAEQNVDVHILDASKRENV